ncbi:hypothetical protein, partial [Algoriphagus ratkowskyi]|uniref:hypothetical protein n=1 Tax=Algoriphagus ratkowskyi TaxID=57028 RepID=UPI00174E0476
EFLRIDVFAENSKLHAVTLLNFLRTGRTKNTVSSCIQPSSGIAAWSFVVSYNPYYGLQLHILKDMKV